MPDLPWLFLGFLAVALLACAVLVIAAVRISGRAVAEDIDESLGGDWRLGP